MRIVSPLSLSLSLSLFLSCAVRRNPLDFLAKSFQWTRQRDCYGKTPEVSFCRTTLECLELMSNHEEFYEDYTAACATESMLRLSYCINRSLTRSRLLEDVVHGVCNVLVRYSSARARAIQRKQRSRALPRFGTIYNHDCVFITQSAIICY